MTIIIHSTGERLDLSADIQLNIEKHNPLFSEDVSMSLPVSLPLTDHNRRVLGFPDRIDIYDTQTQAYHFPADTDVIVTQGSWQQRAKFSVTSCSEKAIEATLYFGEAAFWAQLENVKLPEALAGLLVPITIRYDPSYTEDDKRALTLAYLSTRYLLPYNPQSLTPVDPEDYLDEWIQSVPAVVVPLHYTPDDDYGTPGRWLNEITRNDDSSRYFLKTPATDDQGETYRCVAPFLRLHTVLGSLFAFIGRTFEVDANSFSMAQGAITLTNYHRLLVLNNTYDALHLAPRIPYSALVPDMDCKDFLKAVAALLGCVFISTENGTVRMQARDRLINMNAEKEEPATLQIQYEEEIGNTIDEDMERFTPTGEGDYFYMSGFRYKTSPTSTVESHDYWAFDIGELCQRITTTTSGDEDITLANECPLSLALYDVSHHMVWPDDWEPVSPDELSPAGTRVWFPILTSVSLNNWANIHNTAFRELTESKTDTVTFAVPKDSQGLKQAGQITSVIVRNRKCYVRMIRYNLEGKRQTNVTFECIAPR